MTTAQGLDALERLLGSSRPHVAVLPVNWERVAERFSSYTASPLFSELLDSIGDPHDRAIAAATLRDVILTASPDERRTLLATAFTGMLATALGFSVSDVDPNVPISTLGLDSLTAVEFRNRINAAISVSLPIVRLLQGPTITELAVEVELMVPRAESRDGAPESNDCQEMIHEECENVLVVPDDLPSPGQKALWFVQHLFPDTHAYNLAFAASLTPPLSLDAFDTALSALMARHASLRSIFVEVNGQPRLRVLDQVTPVIEVVECPDWSEKALHDAVLTSHQRPFALDEPLMRTTVFRRGQSDLLLVDIHHLVLDAQSLQILFVELRTLYEAQQQGMTLELAPLPASYRDFVQHQHRALNGPEGDALWQYWSSVLAEPLPTLDVPTAFARPPFVPLEGASYPFSLDRTTGDELHALARQHQTTIFAVFLSAMHVLLHALSGQEDIIIGTPGSLRTRGEWSGLIGFFVNMLPMRGRIIADDTFATLLARTRTAVLGGLTHQEFPFPLMVEKLAQGRTLSRAPIFQSMLNVHVSPRTNELSRLFNPAPDDVLHFGTSKLTPYPIRQQEGQFELAIEVIDAGGELRGNLKYQTALYDAESAARMTAAFVAILQHIIRDPHVTIAALTGNDRETLEL